MHDRVTRRRLYEAASAPTPESREKALKALGELQALGNLAQVCPARFENVKKLLEGGFSLYDALKEEERIFKMVEEGFQDTLLHPPSINEVEEARKFLKGSSSFQKAVRG